MIEQKIQIQETEAQFIENYAEHGFHSMSELISRALELLKRELEKQNALIQSADLYAEVYEEDEDLQDWTNSAIEDWE
jgi:hypothetical protein